MADIRKTLSVGPDSWRALSSLGRFGMSFDDIIKRLLIEHNELMRIKGQKEIPLGPSIYKLSQGAQEQQELESELAQPQQQEYKGTSSLQQPQQPTATTPHTLTGLLSQPIPYLSPQAQQQLQQLKDFYDKSKSGKVDDSDIKNAKSILDNISLNKELFTKLGPKAESFLNELKSVIRSSRYEAAKSMSKSAPQSQEKVSLEYSLLLPGLEFPANKDEMKECAEKVKYPDEATMNITLGLLRRLPDYKYTSKNKLEQDFSYMLKQLVKYLEGRVVTIVYTEPISPEQIEKAALINARIMKNVNTKTR